MMCMLLCTGICSPKLKCPVLCASFIMLAFIVLVFFVFFLFLTAVIFVLPFGVIKNNNKVVGDQVLLGLFVSFLFRFLVRANEFQRQTSAVSVIVLLLYLNYTAVFRQYHNNKSLHWFNITR